MNKKRNPLTPVGPATWQPWQDPLTPVDITNRCWGGALATVARTGTKGGAFSPGRVALARKPEQQALPDRC